MRIAFVAASIGIAACWHAPAAPPAPPAPPPVAAEVPPPIRLAVLDTTAHRLRIVDMIGHELVIARDLEAPGSAGTVVWVGPDPVVGLVVDAHEQYQVLGPGGLVDLAWPGTAPADGGFMFGDARLYGSGRGKQLVYAQCATWNEGGQEAVPQCETWDYARMWPPPVAMLASAPLEDDIPLEPTTPVVSLRVIAAAGQTGQANCRDLQGVDHELHTSDTGPASVELHWLVAEPPIFLLRSWGGSGFGPGYSVDAVFEGCEVSERYTAAFVGPHDEVVLAGHALAVYWHGKLLARAPIEGAVVAFAPPAT